MRIPGFIVILLWGTVAGAAPVTTSDLIEEMADLSRLADFPSPAYKTIQFSSYDRRSSIPEGPNWFANSDGFGKEPIPNFEAVLKEPDGETPGEYLICDVNGPGAIVRTWTAQIAGDLRIYLDGQKSPLYEGAAEPFLRFPYNTFLDGTGITPDDLAGTFYQRDAAYAPIPFAKRCRIEWVGHPKDTHFYQVQVRIYDGKTKVKTFAPRDLIAGISTLRTTVEKLSNMEMPSQEMATHNREKFSMTIAPHSRITALDLKGSGAIRNFSVKVDAPDVVQALRQTLLYIQCDGSPWAQVQSPVGDFFGAGPGINPYVSAPFTVDADGTMTCRYLMPYKDEARIRFENTGDQEVTVSGFLTSEEYRWNTDTSMHFNVRWRVNHDRVSSNKEEMGAQDVPFLNARGKGVYVGTAIMILNPNVVPTEWGNWWGEGDEKIFVDDDVRPSTFGTGSEDYFNYSWSASDIFDYPYCGQPRDDGPANRGFVVNYRWHIIDPLPFLSSLGFYMELFSHERTEGFSYGRISYYYAQPGTMSDHVPLAATDLRLPQLPTTWEPASRFGAQHWEVHAAETLMGDHSDTEIQTGGMWQGGEVIVWTPTAGSQSKTFSISISEDGPYRLFIAYMLVPDGGTFSARLDGASLTPGGKDTVILSTPDAIQSRVVAANLGELRAGSHTLVLNAIDAGKPIGIDFIALRKL